MGVHVTRMTVAYTSQKMTHHLLQNNVFSVSYEMFMTYLALGFFLLLSLAPGKFLCSGPTLCQTHYL